MKYLLMVAAASITFIIGVFVSLWVVRTVAGAFESHDVGLVLGAAAGVLSISFFFSLSITIGSILYALLERVERGRTR